MKQTLIFLFSALLVSSCDLGFKDEQDILEICTKEPILVAEQMPVLIGGISGLQEQLVYPELAIRAGIEGRVVSQFIVNKKGNVIEPRIIQGIGGGADEEAIRLTKLAKFEPGSNKGIPVCVQYSLPIVFILPD